MTDAIEAVPLVPFALYRWFDAKERLLYIGKTGDLGQRTSGHIARSAWMQLAASSTIERHGSLEDVSDAEREAIEAEHPLFNKQYNNTPEARERLFAYLDEIGRLDLLAPKVLAQIEAERRDRERRARELAERAPAPVYDDDDDAYWNELEADVIDSRWERAARDAWWRPWWNGHKDETIAMLDMMCPVRDPTTAIARWLSERRQQQREEWGHPQVWVTYCPDVDYPGDEWTWHGQWSAHADITVIECSEPWEYWTDATAEAQEAFAAALLAAGKCLSVQAGKQAVLRGFDDRTDARMAGAVLHELAWGHTKVALECTALLNEMAEKHRTASTNPPPDTPARNT